MSRAVWVGLSAVLGLVVVAGAWSLLAGGAIPPTVLEGTDDFGPVPHFDLLDRTGAAVTLDDLAGDWWVADFIFTRCTGVCPLLTTRMAALTRRIGPDVRLVSFSVDPDHDTPDVLARYAARVGQPAADAHRWLFLTGPRPEMYRLIGEGFRLNVAAAAPGAAAEGELITHSDRFVLVDPEGRIRGYYHGTDEASVDRMVRDLESLR